MIHVNNHNEEGKDYIKISIYAEFQLDTEYVEGIQYTYPFNTLKVEASVGDVINAMESTVKKLKIPMFDEAKFIKFLDQKEFMTKYGDKNEG